MSGFLLAWHWVLGHAVFAGGLGALAVLLATGPTGWAVLRELLTTRLGLVVLCAWLATSALAWQKAASWADGYAAGAARSSVLIAASAVSAAQAEARAVAAAQGAEDTRGRYLAGVDAAYQRGLDDAKAAGERVAAGLRDGSVRLRGLWRGCEARLADAGRLPTPAAGAGGADAGAGARADSAGRIVRAAHAGDAQVRCLQAVTLIDRGQDPGDLSAGCPEYRP